MPEFAEQKIKEYFEKYGVSEQSLKPLVKDKLADILLRQVRCVGNEQFYSDESELDAHYKLSVNSWQAAELARTMKNFRLQVTGLKGWKEAQITAGGVSRSEVSYATMESKLVPGLYITGEVLDDAKECGGFNLAFAWMTGSRAGRAVARKA